MNHFKFKTPLKIPNPLDNLKTAASPVPSSNSTTKMTSLNSELPVRLPLKRGVQVQQIDPDTNLIVNIFNSISDVCKLFKISPKTLKEKAAEKIAHNGYKWNIV